MNVVSSTQRMRATTKALTHSAMVVSEVRRPTRSKKSSHMSMLNVGRPASGATIDKAECRSIHIFFWSEKASQQGSL